jgi:ligand-binding sensor domain-containing protein
VLVGASKGVAVLDGRTGNMTAMLMEPYRGGSGGAPASSGYNAAVMRRRQCWASKSDVGLLCWDLDRPGAPYAVLQAGRNQPARFVRAVVVDAEEVIWFGADNWLVNSPSGLPTVPDLEWFVPIDSPVTSVQVDGEDIWLGTQAGGLWRISQFDPRSSELIAASPGQAVEALTIRRIGLIRWVVYADGKAAVMRTDNGDYGRSLPATGGIRAVRSAGPWLAGLNDWRDAMALWNCGSLSKEPVRITIQRLANTRIQDFDLG